MIKPHTKLRLALGEGEEMKTSSKANVYKLEVFISPTEMQ